MPHHSIIIPHRNRNRVLAQTLWSIERSAKLCGIADYEIVVVDALSSQSPDPLLPKRGVLVTNHVPSKVFNKSLCLNLGIEQSTGGVLTFLDADMLVGEKWMRGIFTYMMVPPGPHKLCYRARQLKATDRSDSQDVILSMLEGSVDKLAMTRSWFDAYDGYTRCFEAYGDPDAGYAPETTRPIFGNSQFSILRDVLGDLRFNDEMVGAGFEDLWMTRQIWDKYKPDYKGIIATKPHEALLHMNHPRPKVPGGDWCTEEANYANKEKYKRRWPEVSW